MLVALSALVLAPPNARGAAVPEYLKLQYPAETDLKDTHSATESIGEIPESLVDQYEPFELLPARLLPKWRKQFWPETGQPFIDDIKFLVHPRLYYLHRKIHGVGVEESAAWGGWLGMESGWLNDTFRIGLTGYTSQRLHGPVSRDGIGLLAPGQKGYTVLGEAYFDVKLGPTLLRAGRSRVDLPFINAFDFRMTPNTFEGVGLRIRENEKLKLGIAHIFRIKKNTSTDFEEMSDEQYGWDMFNTFYIEGEHLFDISDQWKVRLGAQFTDQHSVGDELLGDIDVQSFGLKTSVQYRDLVASVSYTWTGNSGGVLKPWGGTPSYNSSIIEDFDRAGEQSIRFGLTYDFASLGAKGFSLDTAWVSGDTPETGPQASPDQQEFDITLNYRPRVELFDGLWMRARYAKVSVDGGSDIEDIRMDINYSYTF